MKEFDFGYFGSGDEGYAQYMTAFDRNFGSARSDASDTDFDAEDAEDTEEDDF